MLVNPGTLNKPNKLTTCGNPRKQTPINPTPKPLVETSHCRTTPLDGPQVLLTLNPIGWPAGPGNWTAAPPLPAPVGDFSAVVLRDGGVLVSGGTTSSAGPINGTVTNKAGIYLPAPN
jgi:hypothetical protein